MFDRGIYGTIENVNDTHAHMHMSVRVSIHAMAHILNLPTMMHHAGQHTMLLTLTCTTFQL